MVLLLSQMADMQDSDLVRALIALQRAQGWTDGQMAAQLGVERSMWSLVRRGKRRPGNRVLAGVDRRFPDLRPLIPLFLRQTVPTVTVA